MKNCFLGACLRQSLCGSEGVVPQPGPSKPLFLSIQRLLEPSKPLFLSIQRLLETSRTLFLSIQRLLEPSKLLFLSIQRLLRASKLLVLSIQRPGDCFQQKRHSKPPGPAQKQTWATAQASSKQYFCRCSGSWEPSNQYFADPAPPESLQINIFVDPTPQRLLSKKTAFQIPRPGSKTHLGRRPSILQPTVFVDPAPSGSLQTIIFVRPYWPQRNPRSGNN